VRELHVRVAEEDEEGVTSLLERRGVDYTTISDDGEVHVFVALPTPATSTVLDDLRESDVDSDSYTVMTGVKFAQSPNLTKVQERHADSLRRLSKWELHEKIREIQWPYQLYYAGTILSVIAATAGLLLDQPALVIGAMIIAPQASSALAAPAGMVLGDWELFTASIREQALGLGVAILGAALFAWGVRWSGLVPPSVAVTEIELVGLRLSPTFLSTVGAVVAGVVGAFGYTTEQSTALIGVMIAAAIVPAAAAVGLAIPWNAPLFAIGAFLLLLVNVLAINVGAFLTLVAMGYRPTWRTGEGSFRESVPPERRKAVYAMLLVIAVSTVGAGYLVGTHVAFGWQVNQATDSTLSGPAYDEVALLDVQTDYGGWTREPASTGVTVRVSRPADRSYPDLAGRLENRIERRTGRNVNLTVEFVETRTVDSSPSGSVGAVRRPVPS
jgi:uncharacterized hydrophobic protein (TIGR00341 family)